MMEKTEMEEEMEKMEMMALEQFAWLNPQRNSAVPSVQSFLPSGLEDGGVGVVVKF